MAKFKVIEKYADANLPLPSRKTKNSAGYDFVIAENTIVPSYSKHFRNLIRQSEEGYTYTLDAVAKMTKESRAKPTLVPTGMKCYLDSNQYLELSVRSSTPLKNWIILANGVGIIDSDYVDNPDNEGHIYFQVINLSPFDIILHKGDIIGQGIIKTYGVVEDDCPEQEERAGGFGSTSKPKYEVKNEKEIKKVIEELALKKVNVNGLH